MWASALVHLQVGDRTPPFLLAYVDLAGSDGMPGPRVLARVVAEAELPPGTPVAITRTDGGDIVVEAVPVSPEDCPGTPDGASPDARRVRAVEPPGAQPVSDTAQLDGGAARHGT